MTRNQIDYARLLEERRSNQAREAETKRANLATEALTQNRDKVSLDLTAQQIGESIRHNQVVEGISAGQLTETQRSNLAKEKISESQVRNDYMKAIAAQNQAIASLRQAQAQEQHVANEAASISLNHLINSARVIEEGRHNQAVEAESKRHSTMVETETNRANVASEGIRQAEVDVKMGQLDVAKHQAKETRRHNVVTEKETKRHNVVNEVTGTLHNFASDLNQGISNIVRFSGDVMKSVSMR